jgi:hypothetical protein
MRAKLLSALCLLAAVLAAPAVASAQGWANPSGSHLGWSVKHNPPEHCCPPEWRWYILRNRPYPNTFCQGYRGTVEPYDDNGLLLPPSSRPGAPPVVDPNALPRLTSSRRTEQMQTDTIQKRK